MGDARYEPAYRAVASRAEAIHELSDDEVVAALAHASRERDPYLANVLATEAQNRMRRARTTLLHLGEAVVGIDANARITSANPAAEDLLGWRASELVGRNVETLLHPERNALRCNIQEALRAGMTFRCEGDESVRSDGTTFIAEYECAPILRDGHVEGAVLVIHDVTSRRQIEAALRASEARMRALMDNAADALIVHDLDGTILDVNRQASRALGFTRDELLGKSVATIEHGFDATELARLWRTMPPYEPRTLEGTHRRKDGTTFPVEVRLNHFPHDGRPLFVALARDLTRRRNLEDALRRLALDAL